MITVEIKINNVPTDRIDIVNTTQAGIILGDTVCNYSIHLYDFLNQRHHSRMICQHQRQDGRFDLIERVMSQLVASGIGKLTPTGTDREGEKRNESK